MAMPADYHMHTPLCQHATGEPSEYAAQAAAMHLPEIGFADHSPMPQNDFDDWRMRFDQLDEYVDKVKRAQNDYPNLPIRLGLEVDYLPGQEDWVRELAARHRWDYLIGSVHYVSESWAVDNPNEISKWRDKSPGWVWETYLERLIAAAGSGLFDIIGHADLPKKFGIIPQQDFTAQWKLFFAAVRKSNCAVELNTAGLRKDCQEIYPAPLIVQMMHERQIPITFGSDAHAPIEVGMNFAEAVNQARNAGYTSYCRFAQRRRATTPIPEP